MLKVTRTTVETVIDKNNNPIKYFKFDIKGIKDIDEAHAWIKEKEFDLDEPCVNMYFNPDYSAKGLYGMHATFSTPKNVDIIEEENDFDA